MAQVPAGASVKEQESLGWCSATLMRPGFVPYAGWTLYTWMSSSLAVYGVHFLGRGTLQPDSAARLLLLVDSVGFESWRGAVLGSQVEPSWVPGFECVVLIAGRQQACQTLVNLVCPNTPLDAPDCW